MIAAAIHGLTTGHAGGLGAMRGGPAAPVRLAAARRSARFGRPAGGRRGCSEVLRVLRPGGRFLYAEIVVASELPESIRWAVPSWAPACSPVYRHADALPESFRVLVRQARVPPRFVFTVRNASQPCGNHRPRSSVAAPDDDTTASRTMASRR
jgi:hypothetical protein